MDADLCGSSGDCYSTSGAWIQLSGKDTSFPLCWMSKKQTSASRSTTETETVALANCLLEKAFLLAELFNTLLQRNILLRIREDNEACANVCTAGYSKKLRHLKRVRKINLASVKEQLDRDDTCSRCDVSLFRPVRYINSTKSHLITGYVDDKPDNVIGSRDYYRTSGTWIQPSGKSAFFHYGR